MLEIALVVVLLVILFVAICIFVAFWMNQQEELVIQKEVDARFDERKTKHQEKIRQWNLQINDAKKYLVGTDWRDPAGKKEFIFELFGTIPTYLWYEFDELSDEEMVQIKKIFWPSKNEWDINCFGDYEACKRSLRIRNPEVFQSEIRLSSGKVLPLSQVGYCDFWGFEGEGFPQGVVIFSAKGFYPQNAELTK